MSVLCEKGNTVSPVPTEVSLVEADSAVWDECVMFLDQNIHHHSDQDSDLKVGNSSVKSPLRKTEVGEVKRQVDDEGARVSGCSEGNESAEKKQTFKLVEVHDMDLGSVFLNLSEEQTMSSLSLCMFDNISNGLSNMCTGCLTYLLWSKPKSY